MKLMSYRSNALKRASFVALALSTFIFNITAVSARDTFTDSIKRALSVFFKFIQELFKDRFVAYGLTMVAYFIIIYAAYNVVLRRTRIFEGEGGTGLSGMGIAAGISLTLITILGLHAFHSPSSRSGPFYILYGASGYSIVIVLLLLFFGLRKLFVNE